MGGTHRAVAPHRAHPGAARRAASPAGGRGSAGSKMGQVMRQPIPPIAARPRAIRAPASA
jgi:hypothetical protein